MTEPEKMKLIEYHPFPWSVATEDGDCATIVDANGDLVLCGDVCGGVHYTHPAVPDFLSKMVEFANAVMASKAKQ